MALVRILLSYALFVALLPVLLLPVCAWAQSETDLRDAGSLGAIRLAGSEEQSARKVYIVQLAEPSAAQYHAAQLNAAQPDPGWMLVAGSASPARRSRGRAAVPESSAEGRRNGPGACAIERPLIRTRA